MTPRPAGLHHERWPYPEWQPTANDWEQGSFIREADPEDLRRLGLGDGHAVLVTWQ